MKGGRSWVDRVEVVSAAPVDAGLQQTPARPVLVPVGAAMPDFELTDQAGQPVALSALKGKVVAVTFIYSRCPLPDYCPRMVENFKRDPRSVRGADGSRSGAPDHQLRSAVRHARRSCAQYAASQRAGGPGWHFLTGDPAKIERVCNAFGIQYWAEEGLITHSLQTAVIDRDGRLAATVEGKDFTPAAARRSGRRRPRSLDILPAIMPIALPGFAALTLSLFAQNGSPASCERIASLALPHATITRAELVPAGALRTAVCGQRRARRRQRRARLRRPAGVLPRRRDADAQRRLGHQGRSLAAGLGMERQVPGVGNGGWAGAIVYPALAAALRRGYATASTDTGHAGGSGSFALGHPEKLIDFAYRAVHEMTVKAKAIVTAFYGGAPRLSYWNGCSTGGRQGLKEAQRFPDDYDGIIAGAPGELIGRT